jgi:4-hydroxy-2-oxoglutarate aldolase
MAQHENVVGMKDSAGNIPVLQQYLEAQSATFRVLTGSGVTVVPALEAGASGAILAIALFAGPAVRRMVDTYRAGDHAAAADMQRVLAPLATDIAGAMGPAGMKAAMSMVGLDGGPPRSPLLPVVGDELAVVKARLEAAGLL